MESLQNSSHVLGSDEGFDWTDYSVFVIMLSASALIGIYFGCFGSKQKSAHDYLLGGQSMKSVPVALSFVAGYISGTSLIGVPSEVYTESPTYWMTIIGLLFGCVIGYYFYIPVYFELNVMTVYEYLEYRFNRKIRFLASCFYCSAYLLYLPTIIYIPSLTLSLVTGINLHVISTGVTAICIFYTMIGGLKAVVWTDFLQISVTLIACIAIMIIGTIDEGGIGHVMKTAYDDGKLNMFNMDPNPFIRTTFWTMFIGGIFGSISHMGTSQSSLQRYLSLGSPKKLPTVLFIYWLGTLLLMSLCIYGGILIYAVYYGCDPIANKVVSRVDQIFPHYILDKIGYIPTLPGLFVSGVFGAALSTLSTGLNTITSIIYEDYIKSRANPNNANLIMRLITVAVGLFAISMVFVVERMGKIISVSYIITSITATPVFVLFTLGMMVPISNTKGAIASVVSCSLFLGWIAIGSTLYNVNFMSSEIYPEGTDTCVASNRSDIIDRSMQTADDIFPLFKLSYMLYSTFGTVVGLFFGIVTSYLTGPTDPASLDPRLISPPLRRFLPKKKLEPVLEKLVIPYNGLQSSALTKSYD